jgi:8-oxo-dGTP pyrophosphatase MutT (NUDIX family)
VRPDYACVILRQGDGRFLVEKRPPDARHAAGQWTCYGGRREADEEALACARRELREELGWVPERIEPGVDLYVRGRWIAHFFVAVLDVAIASLRPEADREPVLLDARDLDAVPLSSWHRAVLRAHLAGDSRVELGR